MSNKWFSLEMVMNGIFQVMNGTIVIMDGTIGCERSNLCYALAIVSRLKGLVLWTEHALWTEKKLGSGTRSMKVIQCSIPPARSPSSCSAGLWRPLSHQEIRRFYQIGARWIEVSKQKKATKGRIVHLDHLGRCQCYERGVFFEGRLIVFIFF